MSVLIACPKCQKKLKIEDSVLGKNIKCPGCATVFATKAPAGGAPSAPPAKTAPSAPPRKAAPPPDDDDEDDRPVKKPAAKAARDDDEDEDDRPAKKPAAKKSRDDEDDEDDRPAKKPAAKAARDDDDDEDDRPAKKSAAKKGRASDDDDDDEDDDRPAKKEKKKGSGGKVLLIVGTIILLLCGGCGGVGAYIYYKGAEFVGGAMTDLQVRMTAPGFQAPTVRQGPVIPGPGLPGPDTKKVAGGPGDKPGGPKPGEKPKFASEQQLADAMSDDPTKAGTLYGPLLQLKGKVTKVKLTPDGKVSEIFFEPQVQDLMTRQKRPFPINCLLANPLPKDLAPVGQMVTVKGTLTGAKASATLTDCTVVFGP